MSLRDCDDCGSVNSIEWVLGRGSWLECLICGYIKDTWIECDCGNVIYFSNNTPDTKSCYGCGIKWSRSSEGINKVI